MAQGFPKDRCTGVYVGRHVCVEGTTLIARSDDGRQGVANKKIEVIPAKDESGQRITDSAKKMHGYSIALPDKTYKYTRMRSTPNCEHGQYFACCTNECGLAITGTVTTEPCREYAKIDPVRRCGYGIREAIIDAIPAACATSAREAVEVIAQYLEKYGSQETHSLMFSDRDESWMIEIYGGRTFYAMRMPDDMVAVYGNHNMFGWVNLDCEPSGKDYIFSPNLRECLDQMSKPVRDSNGRYHLSKTIDGPDRSHNSNLRDWRGHSLWAPSTIGEYDKNEFYPLFFKPDRKISVMDVMKIYSDRLEGTKFDKNKAGNKKHRPIGVSRQDSTFILQTFHDLPAKSCHVQWTAPSSAEFCVFVPFFSGINKVPAPFVVDDIPHYYAIKNSFCYAGRQVLITAGNDREWLGFGCQQFIWMQDKLMLVSVMKQAPIVKQKFLAGNTEGIDYVNSLFDEVCNTQFNNTIALYNQVAFRAMYNFNDRMCRAKNKKFVAVAKVDDLCLYIDAQYQEVNKPQKKEVIISKGDTEIRLTENKESCVIDGKQHKLYSGLVFIDEIPYVSLDILKYLENEHNF